MAVSLQNISDDTGEVYDAVDGGTTAVTGIITLAGNFVSDITGTTTNFDTAIRFLSDTLVCNQVLGGVDPVSKTISNISVGEKQIREMRNLFEGMFEKSMKIKGYSVDGQVVRALMVNT